MRPDIILVALAVEAVLVSRSCHVCCIATYGPMRHSSLILSFDSVLAKVFLKIEDPMLSFKASMPLSLGARGCCTAQNCSPKPRNQLFKNSRAYRDRKSYT